MVCDVQCLGYGQVVGKRRTVGSSQAAVAADPPSGDAWPPAGAEPGGAGRDYLRAQDGHPVGVLPAGTRLQWHDLVAPVTGLAARGGVAAAAPHAPAALSRRR